MSAVPITRDQFVWQEGQSAARARRSRKDNPYRPGSADWRAWTGGFEAV
ncbi:MULTISPECIES: hypothetical protein [Aureimonas]|jgi:hypothetical protein|uniref:Uncharacterized protein n=1 Tax=Aureimonas jatrophae TaxID=1166073 RepID=A0A1H0KT64_9HYPH|nr:MULTISPECIES: hypothetical protein [Aureimonas]MBB3948857.1 hypothetical protein [Aureimonas jatrophae]SDO58971.1 hypothetical protein SAMN05192530_108129 [Aureimonas jatrophae]